MSTKTNVALSEENKPSRRKFFIGAGATVGAVAVVDNQVQHHAAKHLQELHAQLPEPTWH